MKKRALITGISGQDGRYLAEFLANKNYEIHGLVRKNEILKDIQVPQSQITLHFVDYDRVATISPLVHRVAPDEIYHLASPSFVSFALHQELSNFNASFSMAHSLMAAAFDMKPHPRIYFAGTSEMFGSARTSPQNEQTEFRPRSLYGMAKVAAYHLMRSYRENHGLFVSCGILYNHESPRRSPEFVTRKITRAAAAIKLGLQKELVLGNLDVSRDWGASQDYVEAMWLMLQQDQPDDFVISTGTQKTLREFLTTAFKVVDLDWPSFVKTDQQYFRSGEKVPLVGNPEKAFRVLGWKPKISFEDLVRGMVEADLHDLRKSV